MQAWRTLTDHQCDICGADAQILTDASESSEGYDEDLVRCDEDHTGYFVVTEDETYCEWE